MLSITKDDKFGTNEEFFIQRFSIREGIRISLVNIHFGKYKIYIFTYLFDNLESKKFNVIKIIDLDKIYIPDGYEEIIDRKIRNYQTHYSQLNTEECDIELNFIKYKLDCEKERINGAKAKIDLYTSVLLVIIPIIMALYKPEKIAGITTFQFILIICLLLLLINVTCFILQHIFVKPLTLSSFGDLRNSNNKIKENVSNYYFDWQALQKKSVLDVSYVKNIQYCIIWIIILSSSFYLSLFIQNNNTTKCEENSIYTVNIDNLESKYSEDVEKISEIHTVITRNHPKELLIICGQSVDKDDFYKLCTQFNLYKDIEMYQLIDKNIKEKSEVKIIIKGD
ncbi:hypothetical protein [Clostridium sp. ZBS4]|uniref:hypothetical protein n=1 Tax=Clostridium sp. ZBS4 TaxID=2949974 RepID=UPI00207ADA11|nr:hypothetical protein [Clostridium sp. ZBS4]